MSIHMIKVEGLIKEKQLHLARVKHHSKEMKYAKIHKSYLQNEIIELKHLSKISKGEARSIVEQEKKALVIEYNKASTAVIAHRRLLADANEMLYYTTKRLTQYCERHKDFL